MSFSLSSLLVGLLLTSSACSYDWDQFSADGDSSTPVDSGMVDSAAQDSSNRDSGNRDSATDSSVPDAGIVRDGLVLHLPFDESGGTSTRETVSGEDRGVIEGGASFEAGVRGNALRLDGIDDRVVVNLDSPLDVGDTFSIAVFLNAEVLDGILVTCEGAQHFMLRLDMSIGQIDGITARVNEKDWPTYSLLTTAGGLTTGAWRHLAFTADAGVLTLFVDGVEADAGTIATPPGEVETASTCHVSGSGYSYLEEDEYFDGALDDVRIYDRALSQAEVTTLVDAR